MADELPLLDMDALDKPIGRIKRFRLFHDVLPIDGRGYDLYKQATSPGAKGLEIDMLRSIIKDVVPSMSEEHLHRLSVDNLGTIIRFALQPVETLQRTIDVHEKKDSARPVKRGSSKGR